MLDSTSAMDSTTIYQTDAEVRSIRVLVFGDQSSCSLSKLQPLLLKKDNPYLTSFIDQVNHTLRHEVARLPTAERQSFPAFSSIQNLVSRVLKADKKNENAALESTLATVYQLCCFISHFGNGQETYPTGPSTHVAGLCIGALAAAAVSSSQSLGELVQAGIDAVRVSLRVGLLVARTAALFDHPQSNISSSWSYVVPESQFPLALAEKAIASYKDNSNIPPLSSPYVSAKGPNSWTVSGPPAVVQHFLESSQFAGKLKFTPIAVHAPYHASHIFSAGDIERVLRDVGSVSGLASKIPFVSSSTARKPLQGTQFQDLLHHVLEGILISPLDLGEAAENIQKVFEAAGPASQCALLPISTNVCSSLKLSFPPMLSRRVVVIDSIMEGIASGTGSKSSSTARPGDSKIAIIGMSGRFPESADVEAFWDLLYKGLDVHRRVPEDRYNAELYYDATGKRKNTSKVMHGCWINEPGLFDAKFFNISPKEAEQSDPGQRLALATAYEALEMAGIVADRTPSTQRDRVGVFYGMTSDDYREVSCGQNVDTYFIPGGNRAFTPGKINYFFKYCGPSVSVDTACSSSLAAIHLACNSIWRNECDTAIAGGTNVMSNPDSFAGLDRGHFLSRTGNCNTFDDAADGYCRADAVGTVVLKRLEDAVADRDPILGVILGAHTNHSAESVSITRPHCGAQEEIFSKILTESGVHPHQVSYIEMHGTGTQAGDATEMASVLKVFAPSTTRLPHESLYLGSTKANVGHSESASGVTALIKVLLMMQKNLIPPHCGIKGKINHKFPTDLDKRNVHIAKAVTEWKRRDELNNIRRAFVNNFSAAGGNTALLLEDYPELTMSSSTLDPRAAHVVTISAKSIQSLKGNVAKLAEFVRQHSHTEGFLAKLSYTSTARRMHHPFRIAIAATDCEQLLGALEGEVNRDNHKRSTEAPVAFVFSGQGSQYSAMGQHLLQFASFREEINSYDLLARRHGFPSILPLIDGSANIDDLEPLVVQLGTTCVQMALASFWVSLGMQPAYVVGHSLGHYAALKAAGVLTASDTIYLVGMRARLLQEKCSRGSHAMLAIRSSVDQIQTYLDSTLHDVACINGPQDTVVSGCVDDIEELARKLTDSGLKATRVNVPFAFHSAQVDPVLDGLEAIASQVTFHSPRVPIGCPLLGKTFHAGEMPSFEAKHISRHCREAVNFHGVLQSAKADGVISEKTTWIELGPHTVCSTLLKANLGQDVTAVPSLMRNKDGWQVLTSSLATLYCQGLTITWDEYHRDFEGCKEVLPLPAYSWDNKRYWIEYVHDWLLTRGDPPVQPTAPAPAPTSFSTASVHRIVHELVDKGKLSITAECEFTSEQLREVVYGHVVNGNRVCTSSLYTDFGVTLGNYVLGKYRLDLKDHSVDVQDMVVHKALVHKEGSPMLLRIDINHDVSVSKDASMSIYSINAMGKKTVDHAQCTLSFEQPKVWLKSWDSTQYYVERSIEWLKGKADQGLNSRLSSGVIYKLFSSLVDYSNAYKGMQEAIVDAEDFEATALVRFQVDEGNFHCNPMWIDSCGQLAGFLMNGHSKTPKDQVFINHGWQSFRAVRKFCKDKTYRTYVRMRPIEGTTYAGDVYIFDDDGIVGVCGSITFQGIPRKVLNNAMPPPKSVSEPQVQARSVARAEAPKKNSAAPIPIARTHDTKIEPQKLEAALKSASAAAVAKEPLQAVIKILSEEIGIPLASIQDDLAFADYGVDSLLSLTISGRLREELDLDVESSAFEACATFAEFAAHLGLKNSTSDQSSEQSSVFEMVSPLSDSSDAMTSNAITTPTRSLPESVSGSICKDVCAILAEEIGVSTTDIMNNANLGEMGMDSLMSLTVLGRIREELEIELDADFFVSHPTFDSFKHFFQPAAKEQVEPEPLGELKQYRATSTLLQGSPKSALYTLFLLPDGSGSATSYAPINAVGKDVCVYGLNCPWLKSADKLVQFGLKGLASLYIEEIRRRAPHGPYSLGGWSAGGICAYEAAIQLTRAGETVERLILLDSPNPIGIEKLPARLFDFINGLGLFGEGKAPDWLLAHFLAFIDALDEWKPVPWEKALCGKASPPKTYILWAEDGVCKDTDARPEYRDDDPREMRWLLENRTNFGGNNWEILLGSENLSIERIHDANHFTMLHKGKNTERVAEFIKGTFSR
ncbi:ketoacyl-synt-domain-containing protein [Trichoderma citrinoviride]|uniref:Ketoacyl-synt-domain-containing protein n=1 Tax=Trichoderma citrinoviride TaxID=58853 RepID=A0A2T4AYI3_9HYPO|nr:ketoacyl-synt-domain-containing protein [Trichoderma citrinoviride]PTB62127.1 ketoacyl-synt-domain-containing protein [Trichoderma citrinoviride]